MLNDYFSSGGPPTIFDDAHRDGKDSSWIFFETEAVPGHASFSSYGFGLWKYKESKNLLSGMEEKFNGSSPVR